jgi:hypothetical protein
VELREALAAVLYAWIDGGKPPARQVETSKGTSRPRPCIAASVVAIAPGLELVGRTEQQAEIPLWKLAQAASDLLVSSDAEQVKGLRRSNLPLALSRPEQEPHPAMVRHEDLRQPDEGAKTPGAPAGGAVIDRRYAVIN